MSRDGANSRKNHPAAAIAVTKANQPPIPPNSDGNGGLAGLSTKANTGTTSSTARPSKPSAICQVRREVIVSGDRRVVSGSAMDPLSALRSVRAALLRQANHTNAPTAAEITLTWSNTIHQSEIAKFWLKCQTTSEAARLAPKPTANAQISLRRQTAITAAAGVIKATAN